MAEKNYELLEENRKAVLAFADGVEDSGVPTGSDVVTLSQGIKDKTSEVQDLVANGDFTTAIKKLDEIKDNKIGIVWHESEDLGNGTSTLVRDARGVTTDPAILKQEAGEKYAMQVLNQVRGGLDLVDQSDLTPEAKELAKKQLMHVAETAMTNIDQLNSTSIKEYNTQMVYALEEAGIEDAPARLNFAKEVANFQDEHRHVVTLTTAEDERGNRHTVTEAEIMLNGLTETQKQQYMVIANASEGQRSGVKWFDEMPEYKQDLLRGSAQDIASGRKVIPTQLLGDVVGVRNAYQKVTAIRGSEETDSKILSQTLHCGAPATKIKVVGKDERQEIANENIRQLQSFVPPDERMNLNILNSKTLRNVRGENFIFDQLQEAKKAEGIEEVSTTASPINRWRLLGGGRDTRQFKDNLSKIAEGLDERGGAQNVVQYLKKGGSLFDKFVKPIFGMKTTETKAKAELAALQKSNPDLARDLGVAIEARNLADSSTLFADSQNVNLELTAKMNIVRNSVKLKGGALNKALPKKTIDSIPSDVNFCKSGKDRTGYAQTKNTQMAVATHLGIDPQSEPGQRNLVSQVAGSHTQEMAGIQGGTIGCHSIKTNPEFGLSSEDKKAMDGVINQKSSHFNSKIKIEKEGRGAKITRFIKKKLGISTPLTPKEKIGKKFAESFTEAKTQKANKASAQPEVSRPRSKTTEKAKTQAADIREGLENGRNESRSRSQSLPPKLPGKDTGVGR